jgi:hypothetical protein
MLSSRFEVVPNLLQRPEDVAYSLSCWSCKLNQTGNTKYEKALKDLAVKCENVAIELSEIMTKLKVDGKHSTWQSLRVSIRSMRKHSKIVDLEGRLDKYRAQILLQLSMMLT